MMHVVSGISFFDFPEKYRVCVCVCLVAVSDRHRLSVFLASIYRFRQKVLCRSFRVGQGNRIAEHL